MRLINIVLLTFFFLIQLKLKYWKTTNTYLKIAPQIQLYIVQFKNKICIFKVDGFENAPTQIRVVIPQTFYFPEW